MRSWRASDSTRGLLVCLESGFWAAGPDACTLAATAATAKARRAMVGILGFLHALPGGIEGVVGEWGRETPSCDKTCEMQVRVEAANYPRPGGTRVASQLGGMVQPIAAADHAQLLRMDMHY